MTDELTDVMPLPERPRCPAVTSVTLTLTLAVWRLHNFLQGLTVKVERKNPRDTSDASRKLYSVSIMLNVGHMSAVQENNWLILNEDAVMVDLVPTVLVTLGRHTKITKWA